MDRRYPKRPILGVGALIIHQDRILLIKRGGQPLAGYWSLPGGVVEVGETLEQAVCREAYEETRVQVQPVCVAEIFERIMRDASGHVEYHYVLVDYLCRLRHGSPQASGDAAEVAWFRPDELPTLRLTEGTLPVILKAFALAKSGA